MRRIICAAFIAIILFVSVSGCNKRVPNNVSTGQDLYGKRIGIIEDSSMHNFSESGYFKEFTASGASFVVYESKEMLATGLKSGLCDCAVTDEKIASQITKGGSGLKQLDEVFMFEEYSAIVAKENIYLKEDLNSAIQLIKNEGIIKDIVNGYILGEEYRYESILNPEEITASITLAVDGDFAPFSFRDEAGNLVGIDVDIATAVCDAIGLGIEIVELERTGIVNAITSGTVDFAMARLTSNETDLKYVDFTDVYYESRQVIVVRK